MKTHAYYLLRLNDVLKAFTLITQRKPHSIRHHNFNQSLIDLFLQPCKRISKYNLLLKEMRIKRADQITDESDFLILLVLDDTLKVKITKLQINFQYQNFSNFSSI